MEACDSRKLGRRPSRKAVQFAIGGAGPNEVHVDATADKTAKVKSSRYVKLELEARVLSQCPDLSLEELPYLHEGANAKLL